MRKVLFMLFFSQSAFGIDCSSDCGEIASFNYPCPTFRNPRRICKGREPTTWAMCTEAKEISCNVWDKAVDFARPRIKPILEPQFNARTFAAETDNGNDAD